MKILPKKKLVSFGPILMSSLVVSAALIYLIIYFSILKTTNLAAMCPLVTQAQVEEVYKSDDNAGLTIQGIHWGARLNRLGTFEPNKFIVVSQPTSQTNTGFCTYDLSQKNGENVGTLTLHPVG